MVLNFEDRLQMMSEKIKKGISTISAGVLGVYLFQIPVINFLGLRLNLFPYSLLENAFVRGIFVFAVTLLLVLLFQRLQAAMKSLQRH